MMSSYFARAEALAIEKQTLFFIDEIDSISLSRSGHDKNAGASRRVNTYLLSKIQGIINKIVALQKLQSFQMFPQI